MALVAMGGSFGPSTVHSRAEVEWGKSHSPVYCFPASICIFTDIPFTPLTLDLYGNREYPPKKSFVFYYPVPRANKCFGVGLHGPKFQRKLILLLLANLHHRKLWLSSKPSRQPAQRNRRAMIKKRRKQATLFPLQLPRQRYYYLGLG